MRWAVLLAAVLIVGCGTATVTPIPIPTEPPPVIVDSSLRCTIRGQLPDPICTPGVVNPAVTQENIKTTICKSGWTATIRPPQSYTGQLKVAQIKAYGYTDTRPSLYEEDHLISLELGGHPTDPHNLWPEPGGSPNPKDKVENQLRAMVCAGKVTLADAQQRIATDWTKALP